MGSAEPFSLAVRRGAAHDDRAVRDVRIIRRTTGYEWRHRFSHGRCRGPVDRCHAARIRHALATPEAAGGRASLALRREASERGPRKIRAKPPGEHTADVLARASTGRRDPSEGGAGDGPADLASTGAAAARRADAAARHPNHSLARGPTRAGGAARATGGGRGLAAPRRGLTVGPRRLQRLPSSRSGRDLVDQHQEAKPLFDIAGFREHGLAGG